MGFPCIVTDWPGRGRSGDVAPERLDYEFVTEAYEELLRRLGGPFVLMTHSMSRPIGWKLLETVPDRVRLVVGIAPGPPGNIQPVPPRSSSDEAATVVVAEDDATVHLRVRGLDMHAELLATGEVAPWLSLSDVLDEGPMLAALDELTRRAGTAADYARARRVVARVGY